MLYVIFIQTVSIQGEKDKLKVYWKTICLARLNYGRNSYFVKDFATLISCTYNFLPDLQSDQWLVYLKITLFLLIKQFEGIVVLLITKQKLL